MSHQFLRVLTIASLFSSMDCAGSYTPREPGRVAVMSNGGLFLVKDGRTFSANGFSSELVDAFSGSPTAEEEAREYVRRVRTGGILSLVGLGTAIGGIALYTGDRGDGDRNAAALALQLAVVPALLVSALCVWATGPRHLYNAVNIYNDSRWQERDPNATAGTVEPRR